MKSFKSVLFFAILLLFAAGCGIFSSGVKIVDFSPAGEVKNMTTFRIEFSENLAPDDMLNKWVTDEFIRFEPKIEGKYKWTSANTLIFSPDFPLEPIQSYKANVTNKVMFNTKLSSDFDEYEFHTPFFDALKAEFFWTQIPNANYKMSIKANLYFNYPVNPGALKEFLIVEREGEEIKNYKIVSESASDVIAIDFGEIQQTDKTQSLKISVKEGLSSVIGKKPIEDEREFSYDLPAITRLAITGVESGYDGTTGWIEVSTTQRVDEKKIKNYVKINPTTGLTFFVNENSFRVEGDFAEAQLLNLNIKKGLPGLYGGELEYDYEQDISLVNLDPSIYFADKRGKYLMLTGNRNVELNAVNISEVDIEVSQVFKNNIIFFLSKYDYYYDYNYEYDYTPYYEVYNEGRFLYKDSYQLKSSSNWLEKFSVNLDKVYKEKLKGIFVLNVSDTEDRWRSARKMLSLSDIGLIAKKADNELLVFANSIATAEPIGDVEINLISQNNQILLTGTTEDDGVAHFTNIKDKLKDFTPRVITAETGEDFNYIDFRETEIGTSRFDVGGASYNSEGYKVFLYGDRNLYRPGEQVNISGIVRNDLTKVVNDFPVMIKIISPTGRTYNEFQKVLNSEGSFEISFSVPDYVQTGEYKAEVLNGAGNLIGTYSFQVEEFVPDKIRLNVKSSKETANPGESVEVNLDAEYLFGAKAAGLRYEANFMVRHSSFESKKYSDYDFARTSMGNSDIPNVFNDGLLDANGNAALNYVVPADLKSSGIATVFAFITVTDLTGRPVTRSARFDVYPEKYYVGIKAPGYYFGTNQRIKINAVAVDRNDKNPSSLSANAKLVRYEWQTALKKDESGRFYYASEKKEIQEWDKKIDLGKGEKEIPFSVKESGEYELRITKEGSSYYNSVEFYAYGWGSSTASSFEVNKEGQVEIKLNKEVYSPGEKAKVLFTVPFAGKMLVTIERNGVYNYEYIEVKDRSAEMEIKLNESYIPNVYITATLFKPHKPNPQVPFLVGHGFASIKVEEKENKLPVSISAPQKIKPNRKQEVVIKTNAGKNVFVTLAAVDEGILQINNYKSPDPYAFMYAKQALNVRNYDLYQLLLPEILTLKQSTGGDGGLGEEAAKRTNPITTKRFQLLAYWSGIRKTDVDGVVRVSLNIPQFNGEVRLIAVAYTGSRFGSAEERMKVADDLIIEPQIPRFLARNDSLIMPVTIINTTNSKGKVSVNVKTVGPLKLISGSKKDITVMPNATALANFMIKANDIGVGKISIETSGIAKVKEEVNISVRPISPYMNESFAGIIKGGSEVKISMPKDFIASTKTSSITFSRFPAMQFGKQLKDLVGYPHGCVEQTTSKLFPQLYFDDLAKLAAPELFRKNNPNYYIKEGIRKLESMQLWDGSLSYWPGDSYSNWWGSVYACHFLIEAKKAGYNISENVLSKLLRYISKKAKEKSVYNYYTYKSNSRTAHQIANKEILYSLYVLAVAGKGDISTMNYYKNRPHLISDDCKYLLAGAYALMGNWNSYYEVIPKAFNTENANRETGGSFDSEIRANAIMLYVLTEVEPASKQIPAIIRFLSKKVKECYSTQETAFAFLALGKAAKITSSATATVNVVGDKKSIGSYNGKDFTLSIDKNLKNLSLKSSGNGDVYYFQDNYGVKRGEVNEGSQMMRVTRTYYDYRTKNPVGNNFYQGELIVCKISLQGENIPADNIAITDLIPSGFEIENPRLTENSQLNWTNSNPMKISYMDIRDDRIVLFTNLEANATRDYYYILRVVNKGKFQLPVISAEAMYDPGIHSTTGRGIVVVGDNLNI